MLFIKNVALSNTHSNNIMYKYEIQQARCILHLILNLHEYLMYLLLQIYHRSFECRNAIDQSCEISTLFLNSTFCNEVLLVIEYLTETIPRLAIVIPIFHLSFFSIIRNLYPH